MSEEPGYISPEEAGLPLQKDPNPPILGPLPLESRVDALRVTINSRVEGFVDKVVSGEELSDEEIAELQERKIKSLDPEDRERIRGVKEKLLQLAERFGKRIKDIQFLASKKEIQSQQRQTFNEAAREEFQGDALFLRETAEGLEADWKEQQGLAYQEMWKDAEGGDLVKVDRFTGLKTRDSLLGRLGRNVDLWRKSGDTRYLRSIRVRAGDLDNFKQGNDILGHDGFDDYLRDALAYRMRQVAVYTGSKVYEDTLDEPTIDAMFPPGSDSRLQLDSLRGKVVVDGYRMKAGADEIFTAYEKVDLDMPEEDFDKYSSTADKVYSDLMRSCVIGRYEKPEETVIIRGKFIDSPKALKIDRSDVDRGDFSMVPFEADYWNKSAQEISLYLAYTGMGEPIVTNDPPTYLRMSAGITQARSLEEGAYIFSRGEDTRGNLVAENKLRGGAGLSRMPQNSEEHGKAMRSNAVGRLATRGASDKNEVSEVLGRAAVDPITGYFLEQLMNEADDISKPQGKRDLVIKAWTAKPGTVESGELALQLGSLSVAGRLEKAVATREGRIEVLRSTIQIMSEKAASEATKLTQYLSERGVKMPQTIEDIGLGNCATHIIEAGKSGAVDVNALYLYYSLQRQSEEYAKNFTTYESMYKDKGAKLTRNAVVTPKLFSDGMLNEIRIARYRQYKDIGISVE